MHRSLLNNSVVAAAFAGLILLGGGSVQAAPPPSAPDAPIVPGGDDYIKGIPGDSGASDFRGSGGGRTPPNPGDSVVVPEPGTIALLSLGLAGLGLARRRKAAK